jgi:hypothetical protein
MALLSALLLSWMTAQEGGVSEPPPPAPQLAVLTGGFAVHDEKAYGEVGFEWRLPPQGRWGLRPFAGITWIEGDSYYTFGGLRYEADLGRGFYLAPSLALGIYEQGDSPDLGGPLEFRSSLELGYRVSDRVTLGLSYYHLSNSSLYESNGGSESLVLVAGARLF